jgi:thymidylate synthase
MIHSFFGIKTCASLMNNLEPIVIDGKKYVELLNVGFHFDLQELSLKEFHISQINEALGVLNGFPTNRYEDYHYSWVRGLPNAVRELNADINTRRAIIKFLKPNGNPTCLSSLQFQIRNNVLHVSASFRSWELSEFAEFDICLITYLANEIIQQFKHLNLKFGTLSVFASNAHILLEKE